MKTWSAPSGEVLNLLGIWRGASFADLISERALARPAKEHPKATRIPASQHTREGLTALIEGRLSTASAKNELVKLATRLIVEEALEGEAGDAVWPPHAWWSRAAGIRAGLRNRKVPDCR